MNPKKIILIVAVVLVFGLLGYMVHGATLSVRSYASSDGCWLLCFRHTSKGRPLCMRLQWWPCPDQSTAILCVSEGVGQEYQDCKKTG